jgi:predicted dehydrogenase
LNIAIVGCGFVADYYLATLPLHPNLQLLGVFDRLPERAGKLATFHGVHTYPSLEALLADDRVGMVLNLTNPRDHYAVSKAALAAGKHVYSEKPLAMNMDQANELFQLAQQKALVMASAPCSVLSETAQTLWRALREQVVGRVRVVYAEMDDGLVHRMAYKRWLSTAGVPWPWKDEFEVGCTLEHAGYYLTWLAAWFGPATSVTAFASTQIPDKDVDEPLNMTAPDFSVACIQFSSGVVARLTCSIVAPHDHSIRIVGDDGVLLTEDCWNYRSPVYSRRLMRIRRRTFLNPIRRLHRLAQAPFGKAKTKGAQRMDFARGPAEIASAIAERRKPRLSNEFSLHVNELALAIHHAGTHSATYRMTTTFEPMEPMEWAK